MRTIFLSVLALIIFLFPMPSKAGGFDFMDGLSLGAGINQGTSNDADERLAISLKLREKNWEYGLDFCQSEDVGGIGKNDFGFVWGSWLADFQRPPHQDYGIYAGAGAGAFILQQDLIDWPAGPFLVLGWDFSTDAGLEGKVGYFGENMWGTAIFYWNFE